MSRDERREEQDGSAVTGEWGDGRKGGKWRS
jgi:hypothetical protein